MKIFIFVFTVFFMLTVTLQKSLAQAATKTDAKNTKNEAEELIKKFTQDGIEKTSVKSRGISETEGELANYEFIGGDSSALSSNGIDRHQNTAVKAAANKNTVRDAIGGGSKTESDR